MLRIVLLITFISFIFVLNAQFSLDSPSFTPNFRPNLQLGGILNPDNMQMNHTMAFMSGVASTGHGFYQSSYTNHIRYQLRPNLRMGVDVGFVNVGTMTHNNDLRFSGNDDNSNFIVPAFSLEFKPSENSTLYIEYRHVRALNQNTNRMHGTPSANREWWH